MPYPFGKIEKKWAKKWLDSKLYEPDLKKAKNPYYNLMMFPYPSAEGLHVGNMYAFTGSDIYGRFQRMQGNDVFEPIGLDGFGIHSENYALKIGTHPARQAQISEKNFYRQLSSIGNGFAWDERLETYDPEYYKWTQWIFVQLFKKGLAYRKKQSVNWCPSCKTVLADEQVIDGKCERCSTKVIKKELEQWFFKITKYADRLLRGLDDLDWSEKIKIAQRNWIGRSEGAEIEFEIKADYNYAFLHGFDASPKESKYAWIKRQLEKRNPNVFFPQLPNTGTPTEKEQVEYVLKKGRFNSKTILCGKSLGAVVALKVLERLDQPIAGLVLIGGFVDGTALKSKYPFEKTFNWDYDFKKIKKNVGFIKVLHDLKDRAVPDEQAKLLHKNLGGELIEVIAVKPHFGADEEPSVIDAIVPRIKVFTTRPDTIFGATYMVLAPEHPLLANGKSQIANRKAVENYIAKARAKTEEERIAEGPTSPEASRGQDKAKTGVELKGIKAINPATKKEIPVWVADYVLGSVGTGAIMAVPAHDERDFEFARKFKLPMIKAKLVDKDKIVKQVGGKRKTQYRLRDWLISRQRYWGPPIPMIYCPDSPSESRIRDLQSKSGQKTGGCGWQPVPEKDLPVKLPLVKNFRPTGKGKSPLASVKSFYETKCPQCGGKAKRETDVSDTFLDSSWYHFGYLMVSADWKLGFGNWKLREAIRKWLPVNMYIGGAEHSVLHLLYSRFITMALHDIGVVDFSAKGGSASGGDEPYSKFRAHGLLISEGAKMSKSKGNVVIPDAYIKKFGADVVRVYLMFIGPFEQGGDWRDAGIMGPARFLNRVWDLGNKAKFVNKKEISPWLHASIKEITEDIAELKYNTAISHLMTILNKLEKEPQVNRKDWEAFLLMLAPFAPFITEELWSRFFANKKSRILDSRGESGENMFRSIHNQPWPKHDSKYLIQDKITLIVQVNGKLRSQIEVKSGIIQKEAEKLALADFRIQRFTKGEKIRKTIFIKNKLINFVI